MAAKGVTPTPPEGQKLHGYWGVINCSTGFQHPDPIGGGRVQWLGGTVVSAEHEPITGVWGRAPIGVEGQSPWSGGQSPPEAESILVI